jgi:hypothetical protein
MKYMDVIDIPSGYPVCGVWAEVHHFNIDYKSSNMIILHVYLDILV